MAHDPHGRASIQARRHRKGMLAVRAMVGETAWLDGRLRWHEGRVVWEDAHGLMAPDANDLSLAQRRLNQIGRYPRAARRVLGDLDSWLAQRRARLSLAQQLHTLYAPDLPALVQPAHTRNPQGLRRLATLLTAEALCVNPLPASPAQGLFAGGERAVEPLRELLANEQLHSAGRALAALILGALTIKNAELRIENASGASIAPFSILNTPFIKRAYAWGRQAGMPPDPTLLVALLADDDGTQLALRCVQALRSASPFRLPTSALRELLAAGTPPTVVVALAEELAALESLAVRMIQRRAELPDTAPRQRRALAERLLQQRQQAVAELVELLHALVRAIPDPLALRRAAGFAHAMLELGPPTPLLTSAINTTLRVALAELRPNLVSAYLKLLTDQLTVACAAPDYKPHMTSDELGRWLERLQAKHTEPTLVLLRATGDAALVAEVLALGVHSALFTLAPADPALHRLLLALARDLDLVSHEVLTRRVGQMLATLGDVRAIRSLFVPVVRTLQQEQPWLRSHLLEALLEVLPRSRRGLREAWGHLARHVPRLLQFAAHDKAQWCACRELAAIALELERLTPDVASEWLEWLLTYLAEYQAVVERSYEQVQALRLFGPLAVTLAAGNLPRFSAIIGAALSHEFDEPEELLASSRVLLERFAGLREPLVRCFSEQPYRCADLLVRVGLLARLGSSAWEPLAALERLADAKQPPSADNAWSGLLALAPELDTMVVQFQQIQALLGRGQQPPPGVQRALLLPQKLAGELAHLRALLAREPERAEIAARVASLAARLANEQMLLAGVRAEVTYRLEHALAEAWLVAAEQQLAACFLRRLDSIAGPLPANLVLNADLLNAVLLANDVHANRRLLLRLLRAFLAGNQRWREQHPANEGWLAQLQARGVAPDAWLAEHPRSYKLVGVAGGSVRLHLECNPLRILQMGSLFDTCLSFGGVNSFSAVANAAECNKRIIYASNGAGHIVGRQLIALNDEWQLVGFHIYSNLAGEQASAALRALFRQYAAAFAQRCGLHLADSGTVPTLFAEAWYDDGIVAWGADAAPPPSAKTPAVRRHTI